MKRIAIALVAGLWLASGVAAGEELVKLTGRIVGLQCAQKGKIGECYLKWAEPMVFFTEGGDFYVVDLSAGSGVTQERLDEAFGLEVEAHGRIVRDERIRISQLNILRPAAGKEFFKG